MPQLVGVPQAQGGAAQGGGLVPQNWSTPDALTNAAAPDSTEVECGAFWEAVGLSLLFMLGGWFYCVVEWANGDRCPLTDEIDDKFSEAFPDGVYAGPEVETNQPQPRDRDSTLVPAVDAVFQSKGGTIICTPDRAPNANAVAERWIRSMRQECFDHLLIIGEAHLCPVLEVYAGFYNEARPHQGLDQCTLAPSPPPAGRAAAQ